MEKADVRWEREDGHVLRLARAGDVDAYWAGLSTLDAEAALLTGSRDRYEKDEATSFFLRCVDDPDRRDLLILSPGGAVLGESVINEIDWRARSANFRICIFGTAEMTSSSASQVAAKSAAISNALMPHLDSSDPTATLVMVLFRCIGLPSSSV